MKIMCVNIDKETSDEYWTDNVGGFHSPPIGWDPNGECCGECNYESCEQCSVWKKNMHKEETICII